MKVIFLDFDGVLNSEGSMHYEWRRRNHFKEQGLKGKIEESLCRVCTSNFQHILDTYREVKIVISSTWRINYSIPWLQEKLASYGIDSSRVIGRTPDLFRSTLNGDRGMEIAEWLSENPSVSHYIVIDDNDEGISKLHGHDKFVFTTWEGGMTFAHANEAIKKLKTPKKVF